MTTDILRKKIFTKKGKVKTYWFLNDQWQHMHTKKIGRTDYHVLNNADLLNISHNTSNRTISFTYYPTT